MHFRLNPNFRSVNNADFYKTNIADIFNLSHSIAGWRWKESDIVQLNGAEFYLWRQYIELAVVIEKRKNIYVSQLFVCAQIIANNLLP